jgi:quaternary ammonium compound-resistance protein SugE
MFLNSGGDDPATDAEGVMAYVFLLIAALFEVAWAVGLKYAQGFTKLWPSVLTITAMVISMSFLALAVRTIPVGTGYAVWTGIGAVGTAILGIVLFGEPVTAARVVCLLLIVAGVIGLKFSAS